MPLANLAAGTALLVALIAGLAWLVQAGAVVNFISESVMVGFKCGVALFLASTQLPKLFVVRSVHMAYVFRWLCPVLCLVNFRR